MNRLLRLPKARRFVEGIRNADEVEGLRDRLGLGAHDQDAKIAGMNRTLRLALFLELQHRQTIGAGQQPLDLVCNKAGIVLACDLECGPLRQVDDGEGGTVGQVVMHARLAFVIVRRVNLNVIDLRRGKPIAVAEDAIQCFEQVGSDRQLTSSGYLEPWKSLVICSAACR